MPLTGTQKTNLNNAVSSITSLRGSLSPTDVEQASVVAFLRRFERELANLRDVRGK